MSFPYLEGVTHLLPYTAVYPLTMPPYRYRKAAPKATENAPQQRPKRSYLSNAVEPRS